MVRAGPVVAGGQQPPHLGHELQSLPAQPPATARTRSAHGTRTHPEICGGDPVNPSGDASPVAVVRDVALTLVSGAGSLLVVLVRSRSRGDGERYLRPLRQTGSLSIGIVVGVVIWGISAAGGDPLAGLVPAVLFGYASAYVAEAVLHRRQHNPK